MNARIAVGPILITLLAGALAGCSRDGDVTIINDCSTPFKGYLKSHAIFLPPYASWNENVYIGKKAIFMGPDEIDIPFGGSTFTRWPFSGTITVKSNETTTIRIASDVGAIYFVNDYTQSVGGLFLKGCSESEYGENLLEPGTELSFGRYLILRLEGGCYDLLVRYGTSNLTDIVSNDTIVVGVVDTILWQPAP